MVIMTSALTPFQVNSLIPDSGLDLADIQGDVLLGLQKAFEVFLFFRIDDARTFKHHLREHVVGQITSSQRVRLREFQIRDFRANGGKGMLPLVGLNVSFTQQGIDKLIPAASDLQDTSFRTGAAQRAADPNPLNEGAIPILPIKDPLDGHGSLLWNAPYLSGYIDGVFLITGGTEDAVSEAETKLSTVLAGSITHVHRELGVVRPGAARGHEHFGWLDGVSQPAFDPDVSTPFPGQNVVKPGLFVVGADGSPGGRPQWMKNGSFMVFRRLEQLVPEFEAFINREATRLGLDSVLLGARMVGRWKSGAPLDTTALQDDIALGGDPQGNNNFDFGHDIAQRRCPFSAHIRKTNPRSDLPRQALDPRRIIRAGIPFGPEVSDGEHSRGKTSSARGLLFVCYQTSISQQFEFLQGSWANNADFISDGALHIARPSNPGQSVTVGIDPIIGQVRPGEAHTSDEPIPNYPTGNVRSTLQFPVASDPDQLPTAFVVPKGGAYFFVPSIRALRMELSDP
jgi:Dyp-type peroxidase family